MSEEYSNGYARGYEAGQESMLKLAKQDIPDLMREALAEQPAQQESAGWRPATLHRDSLSFNPGFPDEQTVKFWKLQGVEIEYCYTSPLLLSPGATLYTSPQPAQQDIPDLIAGALGVSRGTAYDMMREALGKNT